MYRAARLGPVVVHALIAVQAVVALDARLPRDRGVDARRVRAPHGPGLLIVMLLIARVV
jgi:hypothetical protein